MKNREEDTKFFLILYILHGSVSGSRRSSKSDLVHSELTRVTAFLWYAVTSSLDAKDATCWLRRLRDVKIT